MITNKKAITPIVASILLIVVAVILVTIVLNWGRGFTNQGLEGTNKILKETTKNYMIGSPIINAQGILSFKNITPGDESIIITGYKIISSSDEENFNTIIDIDDTTILPGGTHVISIPAFPPEDKITIQLITDQNEYISVGSITNIPEEQQDIPVLELPYIMNGETKLYIHPTDNSTGITWGCSGTLIGAGAQSATDGAANTSAIMADCATRPIAASVCENLEAYGYYDWYLPAKDQLVAIWNACTGTKSNACMNAAINKGDYTEEWSNIVNNLYWSSTEVGADGAYGIVMGNGYIGDSGKATNYYVRCVRDQ